MLRLDDDFPIVRIDIYLVSDPRSYPFALLYSTGSKTFNIQMRSEAKRQGYDLSNFNLFDNGTVSNGALQSGTIGNPIYLKNEKEIFKFLGMEYVIPEERNL